MGFLGGSDAMQETQVRSLGQEYPLEKSMASHSSILPWRIPWTEEPGGLYTPWVAKSHVYTYTIGKHKHTDTQPQVLMQQVALQGG